MANFAEQLHISPGITAIIGSGGKTSLMCHLARELGESGSVIVTTTTHIYPPEHIPIVNETKQVTGIVCVGTPCENGKLAAPAQSFKELSALADYVLVEADGSKGLPLKAHAPHEPVIPSNAHTVICVVGASGLGKPVFEAVHRPEHFIFLSGSALATPESVAIVLKREGFHTKVLINQTDTNETAARELAGLLDCPVFLSSVQKGEIICL